jgi:hypothetical protein
MPDDHQVTTGILLAGALGDGRLGPAQGRSAPQFPFDWWPLSQAERSVMHKHIEIDYKHSRAIVQKIGERLRTSLKPEPGVPARLRKQIDRLREMEEQSLQDAARTQP